MHVRIAWEIYHHQQKQQAEAKAGGVNTKTELLRPPGHLFQTGPPPGALGLSGPQLAPPFSAALPPTHPSGPPVSHSVGFLSTPPSHLGKPLITNETNLLELFKLNIRALCFVSNFNIFATSSPLYNLIYEKY